MAKIIHTFLYGDTLDSSRLVTIDTCVCRLPSVAAAMFVGGNANGWNEWKDADGKTLDEVYRQK